MSEREAPGPGALPGPGGDRFDAVERLRRKLESLRAADNKPADGDGTNLTRLPRKPRRMKDAPSGPPDQPWRPEGGSIYDPAPTRPVTRSELQGETGWWPIDPNAPGPGQSGSGGSVIDFGAARRKRAGEAPAAGIRRVAKPRRIGQPTGEMPADEEQTENPE